MCEKYNHGETRTEDDDSLVPGNVLHMLRKESSRREPEGKKEMSSETRQRRHSALIKLRQTKTCVVLGHRDSTMDRTKHTPEEFDAWLGYWWWRKGGRRPFELLSLFHPGGIEILVFPIHHGPVHPTDSFFFHHTLHSSSEAK